jgi:hypothetical protein
MDSIKLDIRVTIYNTPKYALEYVLDKLEEHLLTLNYNLTKYTWNGKKPYSGQEEYVKNIRHLKAITLLSMRQTKKLLKSEVF